MLFNHFPAGYRLLKMTLENLSSIIAPANTPKVVVDRINLSFNEALAREGVRQNLRERGIEIIGGTSV